MRLPTFQHVTSISTRPHVITRWRTLTTLKRFSQTTGTLTFDMVLFIFYLLFFSFFYSHFTFFFSHFPDFLPLTAFLTSLCRIFFRIPLAVQVAQCGVLANLISPVTLMTMIVSEKFGNRTVKYSSAGSGVSSTFFDWW